MKRTIRFTAGILAWGSFILSLTLYVISYIKLPIQYVFIANYFLSYSILVSLISITCWLIRNKIWNGVSFSFQHYFIILRIRKQIYDAKIQTEFENSLIKLPKIKLKFDNKKNNGTIFIRNSIKFDKQLQDLRLDGALKKYCVERQFLDMEGNWYTYEFYSNKLLKQQTFESLKEYLDWSTETTDDYQLRLDNRCTVSIHQFGFSGQTGSGKSMLLQAICLQLISKSVPHELFIIDPKRADLYHFFNSKLIEGHVSDRNGAIELIKHFHSKLIARQTELDVYFQKNSNTTYIDAKLPAVVLLIDEFGSLKESWKSLLKAERDQLDSMLADIVFLGRQLGVFLWCCSQQLSAQVFNNSTAIRDQLVLKIALGNSDEQTYRTLFASSVDIPNQLLKAGQGVVSYPGIATVDKPKFLSTPFCSFLITKNT